MQVNTIAPVTVRREISIDAPASVIWGVLTGFEQWPSWNPEVSKVSLLGVVQVGTEFRWKTGMSSITSTIEHVDEPRAIGWTGKTFGITAEHTYELTDEGTQTRVTTEEAWDGALVSLLRAPIRKILDTALSSGLRHLKAESERRFATMAAQVAIRSI